MTRRITEGSIRWETQLSLGSFSQKILKKIQHLAFTNKVKSIKCFVPEKVKLFIEGNLSEELNYFQKKYSLKIDLLSDEKLIIPEYKIELLNRSKKILNSIENINHVINYKQNKNTKKEKKEIKKIKKETKKFKSKKRIKTLWVRRKKKN